MNATAQTMTPPSRLLLLLEGRAVYELAASVVARRWLDAAPRGDGHPVLVLPGFLASDISTTPLRRYLRRLGYAAEPWHQGRNFGPRDGLEHRLLRRIFRLHRRHGAKVSLVGWSLGGIIARELARLEPDIVRSVISLGSPFAGDPRANHAWRAFELLSGQRFEEIPERIERIRRRPPVPTTAFYSKSDGVTNWRCCIEEESATSESIGVSGSHCGLGYNPAVLHAIADRLAQREGRWRPFRPTGTRRLLYSKPDGGF